MAITGNLLLGGLGTATRDSLAPHLRPVSYECGQVIAAQGGTPFLVFPETVVVAHVETLADGTRCELGLIGREGLVGWPLMLGEGEEGHAGVVRAGGGTGLAIDAADLRRVCLAHPELQRALLQFVQSFTIQLGRTLMSSLKDSVERRIARWLVMLHDRIDGDVIQVTHTVLATAINVRRASVTDVLHLLEGDRVVRCTRAMIQVRDRSRLQEIAGTSYGPAENAYARALSPFAKMRG